MLPSLLPSSWLSQCYRGSVCYFGGGRKTQTVLRSAVTFHRLFLAEFTCPPAIPSDHDILEVYKMLLYWNTVVLSANITPGVRVSPESDEGSSLILQRTEFVFDRVNYRLQTVSALCGAQKVWPFASTWKIWMC